VVKGSPCRYIRYAFAETQSMELLPGALLGGRYRLVRAIATGGMGTVYEAFQEDLGRRVAVKVVRADAGSAEDFERLRREARAAASLAHPHIGQVYDFVAVPGQSPFVVMELLEGATLSQLLQRERTIAGPRAATLVCQVLSALEAAHGAAIIHRDIKPSNLFVTQSPTLGEVVKVLDFGVAKGNQHGPALTLQGETVGTVAYMSPEQMAARPVDGRSDLFSLGLVLYEMVSGRRAYQATDMRNLAQKVMRGEVEPIQLQSPWIDPTLANLVMRSISADPVARFQTAGHMSEALYAWLGRMRAQSVAPIGAATMPPIVASGPGTGTTQSALPSVVRTETPPRAPWGAGRWTVLVMLALMAFGGGLFAVRFVAQQKTGAPDASPDPSSDLASRASVPSGASATSRSTTSAEPSVAVTKSTPTTSRTSTSASRTCPPGGCLDGGKQIATSDAGGSSEPAPGRPCPQALAYTPDGKLVCMQSTLKWACAKGDLFCNGECASSNARKTCGSCSNRCPSDQICDRGKCVDCPPNFPGHTNWTVCDNQCVDLDNYISNCGRCGIWCTNGKHCINGQCQ
jgi:eukaryotic-like serine/threonine-protein kinase